MHNEQTSDGYKDGEKRRPRSQWVIQRDTHQALISDAVAEALLVQLENLGTGSTRDRAPAFLLSGLLRTPDGSRWYGNRTAKAEFYRVKTPAGSRNLPVAKVDSVVVETVANDLASSDWAIRAFKATQQMFAASHAEDIASAKAQIAALEARASRMMDMAAGLELPGPVLRKVTEIERERIAIEQKIVGWELEDETSRTFSEVTEAQVRKCLRGMAEDMRTYPRGEMRDFLTSILNEVELDPVESTVRLNYRIPLSGNKLASPGGLGAIPTLIFKSLARVA